ncbi:uncharacterized protein LOC134414289 [Melospiza melodia melodia]|uniref:uncharacterized protein LOC134414289 n=1 Tax=Melospiza melodia melodia TaxID=1914991 RepID=UPI002FD6ACF0
MDLSRALLQLKSWPEHRWGFRTASLGRPQHNRGRCPHFPTALFLQPGCGGAGRAPLAAPRPLRAAGARQRRRRRRCAELGRPLLPKLGWAVPGRAGLGCAGRWPLQVPGPASREGAEPLGTDRGGGASGETSGSRGAVRLRRGFAAGSPISQREQWKLFPICLGTRTEREKRSRLVISSASYLGVFLVVQPSLRSRRGAELGMPHLPRCSIPPSRGAK